MAYSTFYTAEEYHQDYYKKNPVRYTYYRSRSGRDTFLESIDWSKKAMTKLRYCLNSAALRFVPVADLQKEDFGEFDKLFSR